MPSLYELTEEFRRLAEMDDAGDEEFRAALDDTMATQGLLIEQKLEAYVIVSRQFEADAEVIDGEIKRLQGRKQALLNKSEQLKERVREAMQGANKSRVQSPLFTITRIAGKPVCAIDDEGALPADYVRVKETRSPDKRLILDALKAGQEIPGCHLSSGKDSLRIT